MAKDIPQIEDNPKAALESFIRELETFYYPWYDDATTRNYYTWFVAQGLSLVSGFATAVLAALIRQDQLRSWGTARVTLVVLPLLGSLASTFLMQSRIAELEALRERGRETVQRLANVARVDFAAVSSPEQYGVWQRFGTKWAIWRRFERRNIPMLGLGVQRYNQSPAFLELSKVTPGRTRKD